MAVERRFLVSSAIARLLQREGGPPNRLIEAHFPARSDRTQLVRVEHGRASLILRSHTPDGQVGEEAVEVPLSHAEALVEVAAGTVAFDRTLVPLGSVVEGVLDRFILPKGLDLLTVTITGDARLFAPPLWLGPEVTGDGAFEPRELAISGLPAVEEVEVTNAALEALLDTLEMRSLRPSRTPDPLEGTGARWSRAPDPQRASRMPASSAAPPSAKPRLDMSSLPAPPMSFSPERPDPLLAPEVVTDDREASSGSAVLDEGTSPNDRSEETAQGSPSGHSGDASTGDSGVEAAAERSSAPAGQDATGAQLSEQQDTAPSLPDVEDGPGLASPQPKPGVRPMLRTNVTELDEGIRRLALSLAPRGPRSTH